MQWNTYPIMKITSKEFARRRKNFMAQLGKNSVAIFPSASILTRNKDAEFPFRQDSDFYYLTGFAEPETVLILIPGRKQGEVVMFCRERDITMELWNGYRAGPAGLCRDYGADDAFPIGDIDVVLPGLLESRNRVYYSMGRDVDFDKRLMGWVNQIRSNERSGAKPPGEFIDPDHMLHDMRLIKSAAEIRVMKEAGAITARAHKRAMSNCAPGIFEYQLEAEINHEFMRAGSRASAYSAIVGSGANGCILHYVENTEELKAGDMVLIDAGCELEHYASDVTRTFPVNGKFSKEQRAIYEIVLEAQAAAVAEMRPGNHWNEPHDAAVKVITQGLVKLGLLKGDVSVLIKNEAYRDFYMHRTGHWLGMDVHDVGDYKVDGEWRLLQSGMMITVEPGIYVSPNNIKVAKKWRGIGIRVEDDVLITKDGCEVYTEAVPKSVEDIELLMSSGLAGT